MQYNGIQVPTNKAINQGVLFAIYPMLAEANSTIKTEIPVSSQCGLESIQAIIRPKITASIKLILYDIFILIVLLHESK